MNLQQQWQEAAFVMCFNLNWSARKNIMSFRCIPFLMWTTSLNTLIPRIIPYMCFGVWGRQGPRLSIRIDIWILPSDTIHGKGDGNAI